MDFNVMNRIFVYNENDDIEWELVLYEFILYFSENKFNVVLFFNVFLVFGNIIFVRIYYIICIYIFFIYL